MPEFRKDPITGRWRLVAEGRSSRPNEYAAPAPAATSESDCPFCEGHEGRTPPEVAALRPAGTAANAPGWLARSIPNRFPSVVPISSSAAPVGSPPFERLPGAGFHEVIIMSPSHSPDLAYLGEAHLKRLFHFFQERVRAGTASPAIGAAILFENRGPESGGTLPHPHAQLVSTEGVPFRLAEEREGFRRTPRTPDGRCLLESVVRSEVEASSRIVSEDRLFVALAPFASEYPYEVWIVPRRHRGSFAEASDEEVDRLAVLLPGVLRALDGIRPNASYNWFLHGLPGSAGNADEFHWHLEVAPRLVRADGYELGAGTSVNPVPPEIAASELREQLEASSTAGSQKR